MLPVTATFTALFVMKMGGSDPGAGESGRGRLSGPRIPQPSTPILKLTNMSCCNVSNEPPRPHDLARRIDPADKRLLNCRTVDVNQLMPLKYKWAWEHYLN